jgi:hypothetical protein
VPRLLQEDVALEAHQIVGEVVVWHNGLARAAFRGVTASEGDELGSF